MPFSAKLKQKIHILIFLVVLCTMSSVIYQHLDEIQQLPSLPFTLYCFAAFCLVGIIFSNGLIYDKLSQKHHKTLTLRDSWNLAMGTSFGNLFGPPKSGLALRAFILKQKKFPYSSYMALLLLVLILATGIQLSLASMSLFLIDTTDHKLSLLLYICSLGSLTCFGFIACHAKLNLAIFKKIKHSQAVFLSLNQLLSHKTQVLKASLLTIFNALMGGLFFYVLLDFFNSPLNFTHCLLIYCISGLLTALAFTPGALGFFEAPPLFFSHLFHIPQTTMIACLIIYRIFELVLSLFFGGYSSLQYYRQGFNIMKKDKKKELD